MSPLANVVIFPPIKCYSDVPSLYRVMRCCLLQESNLLNTDVDTDVGAYDARPLVSGGTWIDMQMAVKLKR